MEMKLKSLKQIGQGAFSKVYLVKDLISGKNYAAKEVETAKMNEIESNLFSNEKKILRTAFTYNFKNIIKLHAVFKDLTGKYTLVLDYCNGGSLHERLYKYIKVHGKPFTEDMVRYLMKQILIGVKSLHDYGIIHRDLKLGNILLNYHDENDRISQNIFASEIKIIDFNVSYFPNDSKPKTVVGTIPNMASPIIKNRLKFSQERGYDEKIDIWSLGTLCYEMLFGKPLFDNKQNHEMIYNILNANFIIPKTKSPQAISFLHCMLKKDGINRLSCRELLDHEFIKGNINIFQSYNNNIINNQMFNDYDYNIPTYYNNKQRKTNLFFKDNRGITTTIIIDENAIIKDVIKEYFIKIKRPELSHNYQKTVRFIFNGKNLEKDIFKTVKNIFANNGLILVSFY